MARLLQGKESLKSWQWQRSNRAEMKLLFTEGNICSLCHEWLLWPKIILSLKVRSQIAFCILLHQTGSSSQQGRTFLKRTDTHTCCLLICKSYIGWSSGNHFTSDAEPPDGESRGIPIASGPMLVVNNECPVQHRPSRQDVMNPAHRTDKAVKAQHSSVSSGTKPEQSVVRAGRSAESQMFQTACKL